MAYKAPGKHFRDGLSVQGFFKRFPDDKAAEKWFRGTLAGGNLRPHCGSTHVNTQTNHKSSPTAARNGSAASGSASRRERAFLQTRLLALRHVVCNLVERLQSPGLGHYESAWFLLQNTQPEETWGSGRAYMGGKRKNMPLKKRAKLEGRGPVGKTAIVGMKDRTSNQVSAKVIEDTTKKTPRFRP